MQRIIGLCFLFLAKSILLHAIPAYPQKITVVLGSKDSVFITLKGDERCKWAISEEGYTLLPDSSGWVYAEEDADGYAVPSSFHLSLPDKYSEPLRHFLSVQKKNIQPYKMPVLRSNGSPGSSRQKTPVTGNRKALVILMSFKDLDFIKAYSEFDDMFNQSGYSVDGAKGSVHDYFMQASYGQLNFVCDLFGPYKARNNMNYYGGNAMNGNDMNPYELFQEAIQNVALEVNLSDYDANRDGYVDNIHIIFAGYGEEAGAPASAIWSHESTFRDVVIQDMKINSYSCAPELRGNKGNGISRIGPHCHEMGHALGAMDFYDTDYNTGGNYEGTGRWDVMASGSWNEDGVCPANFNPYVKAYDFGWVNVQSMPAGQFVTLQPSTHVANQIFRMDSPVNGEYYLLENRQKDGIDSALPGEGLLIYHIHKDMEQALTNNTVNATHPQKCYIVCASSRYSVPATLAATYGNINSAGCPFPGNTAKNSFDDTTTPSAKCWNGVKSNLKLSNISLNGDHTITFYSGTEKNTTVWSESFENDDFMSQWEIIPAQTAIKWQRYTAVNNGNPTSIKDELTPSASDGDYYAGIKNKGFGLLHTNLLILPNLPLKDKVIYKLTFRYQNKAYMGSSGKLSVVYKTENANEWTNIHTYTELSSSWSEKELTLPGNPDEKIRLAFKAELSGGGIFIDDLQLLEIGNAMHALPITKEQTDCYYDFREQSVCLYSEKNTKAYVFDIAGKLWCNWILAAGKNYLKLPSGIYIISQQQQSVKVVVP